MNAFCFFLRKELVLLYGVFEGTCLDPSPRCEHTATPSLWVRAIGGRKDGPWSCVTSQRAAVVDDLEIERAWNYVSTSSLWHRQLFALSFACLKAAAAIR